MTALFAPSAPPIPPVPPPPTSTDPETLQAGRAEAARRRRQRLIAGGRQSTILGGETGQSVGQRTLLGG